MTDQLFHDYIDIARNHGLGDQSVVAARLMLRAYEQGLIAGQITEPAQREVDITCFGDTRERLLNTATGKVRWGTELKLCLHCGSTNFSGALGHRSGCPEAGPVTRGDLG